MDLTVPRITAADIQADALARIATVLETLLRIVELEMTTEDPEA